MKKKRRAARVLCAVLAVVMVLTAILPVLV